ncbi:hypothetical protein F5Y18DRAFT_424689 [Xylariaceae sp. FL1019]|nr:hypothetical protein F5Y18DRAFT_424689 [Xylariaceae sp. FL1019]
MPPRRRRLAEEAKAKTASDEQFAGSCRPVQNTTKTSEPLMNTTADDCLSVRPGDANKPKVTFSSVVSFAPPVPPATAFSTTKNTPASSTSMASAPPIVTTPIVSKMLRPGRARKRMRSPDDDDDRYVSPDDDDDDCYITETRAAVSEDAKADIVAFSKNVKSENTRESHEKLDKSVPKKIRIGPLAASELAHTTRSAPTTQMTGRDSQAAQISTMSTAYDSESLLPISDPRYTQPSAFVAEPAPLRVEKPSPTATLHNSPDTKALEQRVKGLEAEVKIIKKVLGEVGGMFQGLSAMDYRGRKLDRLSPAPKSTTEAQRHVPATKTPRNQGSHSTTQGSMSTATQKPDESRNTTRQG